MAGALLYYSGGTLNKTAIGSLGGERSNELIPDASLENLYDDVNRVEVINGRTEYRMFWIKNDDAQDYYRTRFKDIVIPIDTEIAFAVDGGSLQGVIPQLLTIEDQTPVGLTFYQLQEWVGLNLPLGQFNQTGGNSEIAIWMKRKVLAGSNAVRTISFEIDGTDNSLSITQDFNTVKSSIDNFNAFVRSDEFFTDIDFVGESLLS